MVVTCWENVPARDPRRGKCSAHPSPSPPAGVTHRRHPGSLRLGPTALWAATSESTIPVCGVKGPHREMFDTVAIAVDGGPDRGYPRWHGWRRDRGALPEAAVPGTPPGARDVRGRARADRDAVRHGPGVGAAGQSPPPDLEAGAVMRWEISHRADPAVVPLADRHYNRQKPGSPQFAPPGSCLVLRYCNPVSAFWITSWPKAEYVKHAWAGAWVCSAFRNESGELSSGLIREAVAATRWFYGEAPALGMVTFVDPTKTRHKRDPGRCYVRAGFTRLEQTTKGGLVVLQLLGADMPVEEAPRGALLRHPRAA